MATSFQRGSPCRGLLLSAVVLLASSAWCQTPVDALGSLVKEGHLTVEVDLQPGTMPLRPSWTLVIMEPTRARIQAEVREGQIATLDLTVPEGRLIVRGRGWRAKVRVDSLHFDSGQGITGLQFHGLGIWRPVLALFGGIARSVVGKLEFRSDVPSVLRGDIFKTPPALPTAPFIDLLREARIVEMTLTPFGDHAVSFPPFLEFRTTANPEVGETLTLDIDRGVFRPGHGAGPDYVEFEGRIRGGFGAGEMGLGKDRAGFSRGVVEAGSFRVVGEKGNPLEAGVAAARLSLALASGHLEVPGCMRVDLDDGSRFSVTDLRVSPSGLFSGLVDLDLAGRTGVLSRGGARLSASGVSVRATGLRIAENRATGRVEVSFNYLLKYPLVVRYPILEVPEKRVTLEFRGPLVASLELSDAGAAGGVVRGTYSFKAPWPPIESAAAAALAAKWRQNVVIKDVDFTLEPLRFRPCGDDCFLLGFAFTAEKRANGTSLFRQDCEPEGRANLFLDKRARAFVLKDVRVQAHCRGRLGWVANLIAPLVAKTYSDTVLFQMPSDLPLTIERVQADSDWIVISGGFDWTEGATAP